MNQLASDVSFLKTIRRLSENKQYSTVERLLSGLTVAEWRREPELALRLAAALMHLHKTDQGLELADQVLDYAYEYHQGEVVRRIQLLRSAFLSRKGKLDEADLALDACMKMLKWTEVSPFVAEANNSRGIILNMRGHWYKAILQLQRAFTMFQQLGHRRGMARVDHNLGLANRYGGRSAKAEAHFLRARAYYTALGTPVERVYTESERSIALAELGEGVLAEAMARRAVDRCRKLQNPELLGEVLRALGSVLRLSNEAETALEVFQESLSITDNTNLQLHAEVLGELAYLEKNRGNLDLAKKNALLAASYYEKIGASGFQAQLLERIVYNLEPVRMMM